MPLDAASFPLVLPATVRIVEPDGTPAKPFTDWQERERYWVFKVASDQQKQIDANKDNLDKQKSLLVELSDRSGIMEAAIRIEAATRAAADEAEAALRIALEAKTTQSLAGLSVQLSTLATQTSAQATLIPTLTARATNAEAAIRQVTTAYAAADEVLSGRLDTLTSALGANTASLTVQAATLNGVALRYGVNGYINGQTGGFVFTGLLRNDGAVTYNLEIAANVIVHGNVLIDGSLTTGKIAQNAVTQLVQESVYGAQIACRVGMVTGESTILLIVTVSEVHATLYTKPYSGGVTVRNFDVLLDNARFAYLSTNDTLVDAQFIGGAAYVFKAAVTPATTSYRLTVSPGYHEFAVLNPYPLSLRLSLTAIELKR